MAIDEWIRAVVIIVVVTPRHERPMSSLCVRNANVNNDNVCVRPRATSSPSIVAAADEEGDDAQEGDGAENASNDGIGPGLQALADMTVVVQRPGAESGQDVVVRDVVVKQAGPDVGNGPEEVGPEEEEEEEEPEEETEVDVEVASKDVGDADAGSFEMGLELTLLSEAMALLSDKGEGVGVGCWS
ncbi:hypothetical protein GQ602_004675 [Ophiocordyceps camponoti-floridani]|uniref:Uncharacterized protein n=1 Tax=Ophiocordyceps camponoti-floridani TaxID=2030778 RepID=A0A8H4Q4L7_9HYPO|nr:hypothetical protein GQ602_004675 [Ophiocordyceps camponoti-floridani]